MTFHRVINSGSSYTPIVGNLIPIILFFLNTWVHAVISSEGEWHPPDP